MFWLLDLNGIKKVFVPTTLPVEIKAAMAKQVEAIYDRRLAQLQNVSEFPESVLPEFKLVE